jgi:hypothetical protein
VIYLPQIHPTVPDSVSLSHCGCAHPACTWYMHKSAEVLLCLPVWLSSVQDEEGVPEERLFPISAVTGRGVREAVTAVRGVLDQLGPAEVAPETDALNLTEVPRRFAPEVRLVLLARGGGVCVGGGSLG